MPSPSDPSGSPLETIADESRRADREARLDKGSTLGRYVVLDRVGSGGMGVVYAAYDPQLDRKVALKLLHSEHEGRLDTLGRARLLREAKAMAQLSHPHVVAVHDVGIVDGRVYLAMEHVDGATMTRWLAERSRTWPEILRAFLMAGEGLAAAHAKGLVHRDFKPDNVMVDDTGRVRVMDFGLARGTGPSAADSSPGSAVPTPVPLVPSGPLCEPLTRGSALVGTPAYMAPEQWLSEPVDARSDQYSFCISLYEALYGAHPFEATSAGALMRSVLDGEIVAAPSQASVPGWLRRVVMQGLAREPSQRHPDMDALLAALRADPRARRRRWLAAGVGLAVVAGAVAAQQIAAALHAAECERLGNAIDETWNAQVRDRIEQSLVAENSRLGPGTWAKTQPQLEAYARQWAQARTQACLHPPAAAEASAACFDDHHRALDGLLEAIEGGGAIEDMLTIASGLPPIASCTDSRALQLSLPRPDSPEARKSISQTMALMSRAQTQARLGREAAGLEAGQEALRRARDLGWGPLEARAQLVLGRTHALGKSMEDARVAYLAAYLKAEATGDYNISRQAAGGLVFVLGPNLHRLEQAETWAKLMDLAHARLEIPEFDLRNADRLNRLGTLAYGSGDHDEALAFHEHELEIRQAVLGPDHISIPGTLSAIANAHSGRGDGHLALRNLEQALAGFEHALGPEHPHVAVTLLAISQALGVEEQYDRAHAAAKRALEIYETLYDPDHPWVGRALSFMCMADVDLGQLDRAQAECERVLEIHERTLRPDDTDTAWTRFNLAFITQRRGDLEAARQGYREALAVFETQLGTTHPRTVITRQRLVELGDSAKVEPDAAGPSPTPPEGPR